MKKKPAGILGTIILVLLGIFSIILGQDLLAEFDLTPVPDAPTLPPVVVENGTTDWYEIYFTDPTCPPEDEQTGGIDEVMVDSFRQAEVRVDVAAFDLDAPLIIDALIDVRARGIQVRVVTDTDNGDLPGIRRLRRNGISVVEDKRNGLMHNKFAVIDGRYVWVGSMNLTANGIYCNNNNMIIFDSPRLAANYTAEMDEMYNDKLFGPDSPLNTPNENLLIQGVEVENLFGPETDIAPEIARKVASAQESILFMAFSFTDERVGEAILGRADAGVDVLGVFETVGADSAFSYYPPMRDAGLLNLQVRLDGNSRVMHHKVIIIDWHTVIFGSFNFSESANRRNDENVLIIDDPIFASYFIEEFNLVWSEATP